MEVIVDLHIHSKYSRACSSNLVLPVIAKTCEQRGIGLVATGDFTHPGWFKHLTENLRETSEGIYQLADGSSPTRFIVGTEVASIKKHKDKLRRVHHLLFAPNLAVAAQFNQKLVDRGLNIRADGRPILGLTSKEILELMLEIDERMLMVPAHAWTPWFGIFGSKGGYNTLEEAYDELTPHVRAIETGLSSDPLMNWRVPAVDGLTLISNSDAHSPQKLGREANVFAFEHESDISYSEIRRIIQTGDRAKFLRTIEFYPEEGKYHYDGHAACQFSCPPTETKKYGGLCPKCGKPLIIGVMNRTEELSARSEAEARALDRIPFQSVVPLPEIIADVLGVGVSSKKVVTQYNTLLESLGSEFEILLKIPFEKIAKASTLEIARAVERMRSGNITITPGYDGVFGKVHVFTDNEQRRNRQETLEL